MKKKKTALLVFLIIGILLMLGAAVYCRLASPGLHFWGPVIAGNREETCYLYDLENECFLRDTHITLRFFSLIRDKGNLESCELKVDAFPTETEYPNTDWVWVNHFGSVNRGGKMSQMAAVQRRTETVRSFEPLHMRPVYHMTVRLFEGEQAFLTKICSYDENETPHLYVAMAGFSSREEALEAMQKERENDIWLRSLD